MTRIRIFGVPTQTGIGTHSKSIYENGVLYKLSKYDFEFFNCQNPEDVSKAILSSEKTDLNIYFLPEIFANECKGLNIYYCVFEASRPSPGSTLKPQETTSLCILTKLGLSVSFSRSTLKASPQAAPL